MAKIWQLNDTLTLFGMETKQFDINFISNNQSFKAIYFALGADPYMKYLTNVDTTFGFTPYSENFKWMGYDETDHSAYRTVSFETEPEGELLTWLQANAVAQDQPTVTTTRVLYKGKKELTMAQFEALASLDDAVDYDITDFPNTAITNAQMTAALGYSRLFNAGEVFVCADDGAYTKGHTYQVKVDGDVKSWTDITPTTGGQGGQAIQPLYKHELVIPYSFSVGDSETVNGSVTYHYLSNTGTQITNVSEIDDNFLLSGGIGKNTANTALTWIINEKPSVPDKMFSVKFTSDAIRYNNIGLSSTGDALPGIPGVLIAYHREEDGMFDQVYEIYQGTERWSSQAYRTLTFETAPSGELLTWLQANAVPQGGADSTTVLLLNITVTKAGSSITVEAVNASTMGYITGTVGTITDTVTQLI